MARRAQRIGVEIEDDGSFRRFLRTAPKEAEKAILEAIKPTAFGVGQRMRALARVGPDAPHIKDDVEVRVAKKSAKVGYLDAKPAGGTSKATQPEVALYQQYGTKKARGNAFMSRAAEGEISEYKARMVKALRQAERNLAISGSSRFV